jgi:hypothetical protein
MRRLLALASLAVIVTGVARAATPPQAFLFSQDAGGGSLVGPNDQSLTLTLHPVRSWVTRFSDRPYRAAETVDLRDFLARWHARFAKSPPNSVLSFRVPSDPFPRDMVLVLTRPHYDRASHTMTYHARRIRRTTDTFADTKHHLKPVVYPIPRSFGPATLFIDNASACSWTSVQEQFGPATVGITCNGAGWFTRNSVGPVGSTTSSLLVVNIDKGGLAGLARQAGDPVRLSAGKTYWCADQSLVNAVDCSRYGDLG